jgi:type IV secretory pathway TraG/TraD family ATPase VirD4
VNAEPLVTPEPAVSAEPALSAELAGVERRGGDAESPVGEGQCGGGGSDSGVGVGVGVGGGVDMQGRVADVGRRVGATAGRVAGAARRVAALLAGPAPPLARAVQAPAPLAVWDGPFLGWWGRMPVFSGHQHSTLVLGPPRSGKTTGYVVPNVAWAPGAVVATSTKADVLAATIERRSRAGKCWYFDPSATTEAPPGATVLRWSPLAGCEHWDTATARAHALAGAAGRPGGDAAHWTERAEALIAPLLHVAAGHGVELDAVIRWVLTRDLTQPLAGLTAMGSGSELAAQTLAGIAGTDERERSGIESTAARILSAYRHGAALDAACHPNFDPDAFAASTDTLYLVAPSAAQGQLSPIVVALLHHIRDATYRRARTGVTWPPVLYALDELANIAPLPDLPILLAEGASQGLLTLACLQDLSQARHRWGPQADGFLTLFGAKVTLGGIADRATLANLSYLAGDHDVPYRSDGGHQQGLFEQRSWSTTIQRRPRIPPETIATLPPGVALLNHTWRGPIYLTPRPPPPPFSATQRRQLASQARRQHPQPRKALP